MPVSTPLLTSDRSDWCTPAVVLDLVRAVATIGLDPCSNANSIVNAEVSWNEEQDGLSRDWSGHGLVYCNPPYTRRVVSWLARASLFGKTDDECVALLPSRTDTSWFAFASTYATAICFWRGRLKFIGAKSTAPFPSAIFYFGPRRHRFADIFGSRGWVVLP